MEKFSERFWVGFCIGLLVCLFLQFAYVFVTRDEAYQLGYKEGTRQTLENNIYKKISKIIEGEVNND